MKLRTGVALVLCLGLTASLALALLARPTPVIDLTEQVRANVDRSGVEHGVTAVLLNFRSLDTLFEVGVLLLAVVVALALREAQTDSPDRMGMENPLLHAAMSWLLPLMLLVAGYLLWAGSSQPGGAFQAGAVLAATGVLLRLAGIRLPRLDRSLWLRLMLVAGLALFVAVGAAVMADGSAFLAYPPAAAKTLIVTIELALSISIGLSLVSLFRLAPPQSHSSEENPHDR